MTLPEEPLGERGPLWHPAPAKPNGNANGASTAPPEDDPDWDAEAAIPEEHRKRPKGAGRKSSAKKLNIDPFAANTFSIEPHQEHALAQQCVEQMVLQGTPIYQRAGMLVRVVHDQVPEGALVRTPPAPRIEALPKPILRAHLDALGPFRDEEKIVHPPQWTVDLVDALGDWPGVRRLEAVIQTPVLRADGSVVEAPGHDASTGLLYAPNDTYEPVRPCPTRDDARAALDELLEIVADFPFEQEKHRSAYIALLLTPFARYAFHGPAPLGVIDGTTAGVGKGLLAQIIGLLVDGCELPPTSQPESDEEERKLITSLAMAGRRLVLIDNVTRPVGSGALEALLTTTKWSDRVLGVNKFWEGDVAACWFVTGNNVQFRKKDTIRRVVHVRLQSRVETPEARANWRHPDLPAWVRENRPRLVRAALTVLRAHALSGDPTPMVPWGSFEGWSKVVRGAVVWMGLPDPAETRTELAEVADTELASLKVLLERWTAFQDREKGLTCKRALEIAREDGDMQSSIDDLCPVRAGAHVNARKLGLRLRDLKGRVVSVEFSYSDGTTYIAMMCFENQVDRKGISTWRAVTVE